MRMRVQYISALFQTEKLTVLIPGEHNHPDRKKENVFLTAHQLPVSKMTKLFYLHYGS